MTVSDFEPTSRGQRLKTAVRRASGRPIKVAQDGAATLRARLPGTVNATRSAARATTNALQTLPDTTLRSMTATALGVGAGLYLAGKHRLAVAAGVGPALFVGAAIMLRPGKPKPFAPKPL